MMFRNLTVIVLLMLLTAKTASAKTQTITVCLPSYHEELATLTLLAAQDIGAFERAGLKIKFTPKGKVEREEYSLKNSATPAIALNDSRVALKVAQGKCQIGASTIDHMLVAKPEEISGTEPLFVSSYSKDYDTHLITAKESKIKTLKDLKGKRVRMGQLPNGMALEGLLKKEGMSLKDIEQVHKIPVIKVLAMLEQGKIDAAITYVPTMPYMLASGKVRIVSQNILGNLTGSPLPHSVILVNKDFRNKNSELMKGFISAIMEAEKHFERNPSQIALTFAKHSEFLGNEKWNIDPVIAERSNAFIGKIAFADLTQSEAERVKVLGNVEAFRKKIDAAKYVERTNDLSRWFGITTQAAL